jgi:hypothetical protein
MAKKALIIIPLLLFVGTLDAQQEYRFYRFEFTPFFGYDFSTDVKIEETEIQSGGEYDGYSVNKLDVKSGPAYGIMAGVNVSENFMLEFIWSRLGSKLAGDVRAPGETSRQRVDFFDMNVDNFHFNLLFQEAMDYDERVWLFFFGGLGGTRFGPEEDLSSTTKFSFNLGGGGKVFFHNNVGVRFQARWIPTFIQSGEAIWCDWYGWCWAVPTGDYLHQFELTGGLILRF